MLKREYCAWCNRVLLPPVGRYKIKKKNTRRLWGALFFCIEGCLEQFLEGDRRSASQPDQKRYLNTKRARGNW